MDLSWIHLEPRCARHSVVISPKRLAETGALKSPNLPNARAFQRLVEMLLYSILLQQIASMHETFWN